LPNYLGAFVGLMIWNSFFRMSR